MELNVDINWSLILPFVIVGFVLMIIALISCLRAEQTRGPKWMWLLIIIFINILGPILYFIIGRKEY